MDFDMDPRGNLPSSLFPEIYRVKEKELQSVAGHEFAHHLCGHLKDDKLVKATLLSVDGTVYEEKFYTKRQQDEFEADIQSINRPNYGKEEYFDLVEGSLIWFASVMIGEAAKKVINPGFGTGVLTHPAVSDRFNNILENLKYKDDSFCQQMKTLYDNALQYSDFIVFQDVSSLIN